MTSGSTIETDRTAPGNSQGGTQAVDRAAALLTHVVEADAPVTFAELSEASGLARSTTSRLLAALERTRLLERSGTGEYVGGPLFVLYAARHDRNKQLARLALPMLEAIGESTGETVHVAVANGGRVEHIAQVDSTFLLGARDWTDVEVPAHCSALGKVLLAWDVLDRPAGRLETPTGHSLRSRGDLDVDLAQVRAPRVRGHPRRARGRPRRRGRPGVRPGHRRGRSTRHRGGRDRRRLRTHGTARGQARPGRSAADRTDGGALGAAPARNSNTGPRKGHGMTPDEILKGLYDETLVGNAPRVLELTHIALDLDMEPQNLLFDALIPSLEEVGARFERGDFFVPEMLIAGRAMAGSMEVLRPLLAETGVETVGKFLMGTVKGDVHDIGKNLVNIMLEGAGFEVIDLGVQVAPETFVAKIEEHQPDIVGFSAFLTTTMPMFKANINALQKAGMRDSVIVMVGGAPVTQEYADAVGADGYAADASSCVKKAKALLFDKRSKVPA